MTKEQLFLLIQPHLSLGKVATKLLQEKLYAAIDRHALSVVEASVPEETYLATDSIDAAYCDGFNFCRSQVLENAKKLLNVGGETKN